MLNPNTNQRELAYIVEVAETKPLEGYDKVHYIRINLWWVVATKSLNKGDKAIYFEIDSLLPESDKRFEFMAKKKFRVKTQKMCRVTSQGLALPITEFPELKNAKVGDFVTDKLKVSLYEPEVKDYKPQSKVSPFQKAMDRHKTFFRFPPVKFMLRFNWFRSLMKKVFIHKKDKIVWPSWLPKTGSERIQNLPQLLDTSTITEVVGENEIEVKEKSPISYVCSEKVDGMSSSYILDEKNVYYVGSHNVIVYSSKDKDSKNIADGNAYIKNNIWMDMGEKYNLRDKLKQLKEKHKVKTVAIQGESYGSGVQKRTYSKKHGEQDFVVFHIWFDGKRIPMQEMTRICDETSLPHVNIFNWDYHLPSTVEEIIKDIDSKQSAIDGGDIEGFVFYSQDGQQNFKCVSPNYLMKYHG